MESNANSAEANFREPASTDGQQLAYLQVAVATEFAASVMTNRERPDER